MPSQQRQNTDGNRRQKKKFRLQATTVAVNSPNHNLGQSTGSDTDPITGDPDTWFELCCTGRKLHAF